MIIAESEFTIDSPQERVEELLMKAMISALQPEGMDASDERSFVAMVRAKIGPIGLPLDMVGEVVSPTNPMEFMIKFRGQGGIIWLNQKATFTLTPINEGKTEVMCQVDAEGMATLLKTLLMWRIRSFANEILQSFETRLRQWA